MTIMPHSRLQLAPTPAAMHLGEAPIFELVQGGQQPQPQLESAQEWPQPSLELIHGDSHDKPKSREVYEDYIGLRIAAGYAPKLPEAKQLERQEDVRAWIQENYPDVDKPGTVEDYTVYDEEKVRAKFEGVLNFLTTSEKHRGDTNGFKIQATRAFLDAVFAMYNDRNSELVSDRDGSFAFIVPMRVSRNNPRFGKELGAIAPALEDVPNDLRAWMMRGLPPFIADTYKEDGTGKRGYLVCVPSITSDMKDDLSAESMSTFIGAGRKVANDGADFAINRLGTRVIGLGATLPMITGFGDSVRKKFGDQAIVTTGHGGTVDLIRRQIDSLTDGKPKNIGVLGLGSIGLSAAEIIAQRYPDATITAFDTNRGNMKRLEENNPGRFKLVENEKEVLEAGGVIVSAVVLDPEKHPKGYIDPRALGVESLRGTVIIDDSQPTAFNEANVESLGGNCLWVIGTDKSGEIQRVGYDYGTMVDAQRDMFGCELEAATLSKLLRTLEAHGFDRARAFEFVAGIAITGKVTSKSAARIGRYFNHFNIGVAPPQANGRPVQLRQAA